MRKAFAIAFCLTGGTCAAAASVAAGNCYEGLGCVSGELFSLSALRKLGCQPLWEVRNQVFHARGYCFAGGRAKAIWGNAGCRYHDPRAVPLNAFERANIARIAAVEAEKRCSGAPSSGDP